MGLSPGRVLDVELVAYLHDIGQIGMPRAADVIERRRALERLRPESSKGFRTTSSKPGSNASMAKSGFASEIARAKYHDDELAAHACRLGRLRRSRSSISASSFVSSRALIAAIRTSVRSA